MTQPATALKEPQADDPLPEAIPYFFGGNFVSPAYYISQTIKNLTGFDVFGWASEQVAGDWEAVRKAAGAAENLSSFNSDFAAAVQTGWQNTVQQSWHGHAANSAHSYFQDLAGKVDFQTAPLKEIGRELTNIANSMMNLARVLGDLLQDLVDLAILWLASAAAEAVLASTLVGAPAAAAQAAVSAAYAVMMVERIGEMMKKVTLTYKTITGIVSLLQGLSSHTSADKLPPLPNAAYHFPGA